MKISLGNSRKEKRWKPHDMSLKEFSDRIAKTVRTAETVDEYRKMSKQEQDDIKDVGGFVLGTLKGGSRKKENVISRSGLTLDMDYALPNTVDMIEMFTDYKAYIYSTHKHTPDKPRLRLVVPLSREVDPEEYQAIARKVAEQIDIEQFDDTTYEPSRLMYWPSTSSDGEFVYKELEGELLNPDDILCLYKNWKDTSTWPVSMRQREVVNRGIDRQEDPLSKGGVIGAFCKAYSIEVAIDTFLRDVYTRSEMPGRYDFIGGSTQAGVVLYEDKFAYSHHATDPVGGQLLNAFDIVRLHKFRDKDDYSKEGAAPGTLPSYKAMCDFAIKDERVKIKLAEERQSQAKEEFEDEKDWRLSLELDRGGQVKDNIQNLVKILENNPDLKLIEYNSHRDGLEARGELPWKQIKPGWSDSDMANLKVYVGREYGIYSPQKIKDALIAVASQREFHPIKEYISLLPEWDGVDRVDTLLIDYMGAEDNAYTRAVTRKTLVAAIARIYRPGTKFDSVLILNGPQGIGKSTLFAKLGGQWFSDALTLTDMRDKSGAEKLQGYWILELGELAGMRKADVETVKSFISREDDKYRAAYGVNVESHPRQCIVVGSTNAETGFLRDITGNRRFWPVRVSGDSERKPWDINKEVVRQLWAEALCLYKAGEKLYLDKDLSELAMLEQTGALEQDEREGLVRDYLDRKLPKEWESMGIYERRNFLNNGIDEFGGKSEGEIEREFVCNLEVWSECFGKDPAAMQKADAYQIAGILKRLEDWKPYKGTVNGSRSFTLYGKQRALIRIKNEKQDKRKAVPKVVPDENDGYLPF